MTDQRAGSTRLRVALFVMLVAGLVVGYALGFMAGRP